ncbi:MAG: hypothetical protein LBD37_02405 [Treponema sp.]|jgi:hypothetical protein|nr:hypothetical protein [Treponema sp.]
MRIAYILLKHLQASLFPVLALSVFLMACPMPTGDDPGEPLGTPPAAPTAPDKPALSIVSQNTQTSPVNQGGTITATWTAVEGAVSYKVYYAPCIGVAVPSIPGTPAATVSTTTAAITAQDIGNNTMDYYVWIKAVNAGGDSPASPAASTLARFVAHWTDPNGYDDGIYITNADALYEIFPGYGVYGYIRAVIPFGEEVNFNTKIGAAGVIIVEYDADYMAESNWMYADGKYFNAIYYYGLTGYQTGSKVYLGWAALIADTSAGCEAEDVGEATGKFTFADRDLYIEPSVAALYEWSAD